ncbi:DUF3348 domain-containing protein [Lysobacter sp. GX 14042]|uniref:DUF3348 domain-containing protein n=1 Tax=Lysobacter sp. GX 14042 TaxID=2907155 RepID=UPI001F3D154D|nr:DUF3348 domain-containing protein [Lysobacter sp. GX 14042]MCE7033239.1 DUF3348 domain-containing protein [Lysobacter sp. GX 14042]
MAKASQREAVPAPAFIRLLARLADVDLRAPGHALVDRLGEWIDWTRAVALSSALDGRLPAAHRAPEGDGDAQQECARVRAALVAAIGADPETAAPRWRGKQPGPDGYAVFRERYLDLQRMMQAEVGRLRGQLRDRLGQASAELARLAKVDAVMDATLSPREHVLLATAPALLGHHFERLRADALVPQAHLEFPPDPGTTGTGAWLDVFRQDMRNVLLAELDVRFHPVEGLLAALRTE